MKSSYRYLPGSRDRGQRYVVSYRDGLGTRRDFGFTDDRKEAAEWKTQIDTGGRWTGAEIRERVPA